MDGLSLKTFVLGELYNNSYVIFDEKNRNAFVIDAPQESNKIKDFIHKEKFNILFVVLTHGHFDHIAGLDNFTEDFYIHVKDAPLLTDDSLNGSLFFNLPVTVEKKPLFLEEDKPLCFNSHTLEVIHTPGHTLGSVSLKINKWLFSGDTLFFNSIGRTDAPLASHNSLVKSIKEKIFILPSDTIVYPGHGPSTTIEREKEFNPFLT